MPNLCLGESLKLIEVAQGIYVHQGTHELPNQSNHDEIANIGFVIGTSCVAVIDSGGNPNQGRALKLAISEKTSLPICYVVNTHVHPDHILGNIAFKDPSVRFVGHSKLRESMAERAPYYLTSLLRETGIQLEPQDFVPPDIEVKDQIELDLGDRTLIVQAQPTAHTNNDLTIFDPKTKTLWLSDLLFMGHLPVVDGSLNGWLQVIEALRQVDASIGIPGHGPVSVNWPLGLLAEETYLKMLQTEIRAAIKAKKTIEQAQEMIGQNARDQWRLFNELHKRNITTSFAELEWED
jgi:quinoprotein relay system zinc metallohydrolase 2